MRTTNLDDAVPGLRLLIERFSERANRRQQLGLNLNRGGDMHRGGEGVVARLTHVHMIVGVDRVIVLQVRRVLAGAHRRPVLQADEVRDNLVGVHIRRRSRTSLEDIHREVTCDTTPIA